MAVPDTRAPNKSVAAAKSPMAAPPITVKGIIYLSKILSNTLMSCLNPATCKPEAAIFCARYSQDWRNNKKDVMVHQFKERYL